MAWFKRIYARKWVRVLLGHVLGLAGAAVAVIELSWVFGGACPTYVIFKVCCPFCGMTRAHLAALRLDFATAMYYHPVFYCGIPFLWLLAHEFFFKKKWAQVLRSVLIGLMLAALIGVWIWRVCTLGFQFFG